MNFPKANEIKGRDLSLMRRVSQSSETVTQSVTHAVARYARTRTDSSRRKPKHCAGPYLTRRGRFFYFHKRLPKNQQQSH